jgi:hypothetical protein
MNLLAILLAIASCSWAQTMGGTINASPSAGRQPGVHVGMNTSHTIPDATAEVLFWDHIDADYGEYNVGNLFDGTFASSDTFTTRGPGVYLLQMQIRFTNYQAAGATYVIINCTIGDINAGFSEVPVPIYGTLPLTVSLSNVFYDSGGHTVQCELTQNSGNTLTYGGYTQGNYAIIQKLW